MRNTLIALLLSAAATLAASIAEFKVTEVKIPSEAAPGEKFTANIRLKATQLDETAYYRPFGELSWNNGKLKNRLTAKAFIPWKIEHIKPGSEFTVAINLQIPEELKSGDSGVLNFWIHHPASKKYGAIDGKIRYSIPIKVKKAEQLKLSGSLPILTIPLIVAPGMNGNPEDWKNAATIGSLTQILNGQTASVQTQVKTGYDKKNLYVAFFCAEEKMDSIKAQPFTHHDGAIFNNDCVEMFFRPDIAKTDYAQFIVDTLNQHMDTWSGDFAGFNPPWQSTVSKTNQGWLAEAAIPLSAISSQAVEAGTVWQGNFFRGKAGRDYSAWSPTYGGTNLINRYGYLIFESPRIALQKLAAAIKVDSNELAELKKQIDSQTDEQLSKAFEDIQIQLKSCRKTAEQRLFAELHAKSGSPVIIQQADFYNPEQPQKSPEPILSEFDEVFLSDEVRNFAFNITNISRKTIHLRFTLRYGKEPGINAKSYDAFRLGIPGYRITWFTPTPVASLDGTPVWDVMPENPGGVYVIPPGETVQAALSIQPDGATGARDGFLVIQDIDASNMKLLTIPVKFTTLKKRLSEAHPKLVNYGWDMLYPVIAQERPDFAKSHFATLRRYGFNMVTISCLRHLPRPKADQNGEITGKMDFSNLHNLFKLTGTDFDRYYLNVDIWEKQHQRKDLFGLDFADPAYSTAFKNWFRRVLQEFDSIGIKREQLIICPYDESVSEQAEQIAGWIKECDPKLKILLDSSSDDLQRIQSIDRYADIWMPHMRTLNQEALAKFHNYIQSTGKPVMTYYYSTGANEKLKSPYADYILSFWTCFDKNLSGIGYWAAGQYYGDPWYRKAYPGVYDTALMYPTENGVIPSRRLMSWLRGTQDFQLLKLTEANLPPQQRESLRKNVSLILKYPNDQERAEALRRYCREVLNR